MPGDLWKFNLLLNERLESFWDDLWLGIRPVFCFMAESRRIVWGRLLVVEN